LRKKKGLNGNPAKSLIFLARPREFEPRAYGLEVIAPTLHELLIWSQIAEITWVVVFSILADFPCFCRFLTQSLTKANRCKVQNVAAAAVHPATFFIMAKPAHLFGQRCWSDVWWDASPTELMVQGKRKIGKADW